MTVDEDLCQETESLVLSDPRPFYSANIPVGHPQLRQLICSPNPDTLYYASDDKIYRLSTRNKKVELVTSLPFGVRCLAAAKEWVCAGGPDNGSFAFIKIHAPERYHFDGTPINSVAEMDALLPEGLDPLLRRQHHRLLTHQNGLARRRPAQTWTQELGELIVNSVTLYESTYTHLGEREGTVAVLTNNDKAVRLFSLSQSRLLATLDFPFATNHATVSPNGELMVVVGDDPIVYFCRRDASRRGTSTWNICSQSFLPNAPSTLVARDGCFATAFSPSGHLCAVASQDGIITIFGTQYVGNSDCESDEDAIIKVMSSSRPHTDEGAIRSICFSPEPWDLLICVEHSGRVCVMDVRDQFRSRQVIKVAPPPESVERVQPRNDTLSNDLIDPRLREDSNNEFIRQYRETIAAQDRALLDDFAGASAGASSQRRRVQRQPRDASPQPFAQHEREVLDAIRTSRERSEAREQQQQQQQQQRLQQGPLSISYAQEPGRQSVIASASSAAPSSNLGVPAPDRRMIPPPWPQSPTSVPSFRDYIRDRNIDRDRTRTRTYEPRRHSSIAFSHSDGTRSNAGAIRDVATDFGTNEITMSPPRLLPSNESAGPWQTIEAAMASGPLLDAASRPRRERETGIEPSFQRRQEVFLRQEQRRRERLRNLYAEVEGISRYNGSAAIQADLDAGSGTSGCAMSEDGRKLYIGLEKGIVELHVNIHARKCFPQVTPM